MGNDSVVLWWVLALSVLVIVMRYRQEFVDIFWTPPPNQSNSLFTESPVTYAAQAGLKSVI